MSITSDRIREYGFIHALVDDAADEIEGLEKQIEAVKSESAKRAVEIRRLQEWIHEEGERNNTFTYNIIGEVCRNCGWPTGED